MTETCLPYTATSSCTRTGSCPALPPGKFTWRQYSSVTELQQHIMTYGAVVTSFAVYGDFYTYWSNPTSRPDSVYVRTSGSRLLGYHAVLAVGWGTTSGGTNYWILKNSWGTGSGNGIDGYFRMAFGTVSCTGCLLLAVQWPRSWQAGKALGP